MLELFAFGTFWFWTLLVAEIVLLFVFTENENGVAATISICVFAGLLQWAGGVDIIGFITLSPVKFFTICLCYFLAGAVWGVAKWWLYVGNVIERTEEHRDYWFKSRGYTYPPTPGSSEAEEWKEERRRKGLKRPLIRNHKADFMRWMTFWWISLIWSIFADFIKGICKQIYKKLATFLQAMADNMWRKHGFDPDEDDD